MNLTLKDRTYSIWRIDVCSQKQLICWETWPNQNYTDPIHSFWLFLFRRRDLQVEWIFFCYKDVSSCSKVLHHFLTIHFRPTSDLLWYILTIQTKWSDTLKWAMSLALINHRQSIFEYIIIRVIKNVVKTSEFHKQNTEKQKYEKSKFCFHRISRLPHFI